MLNVLANYMMTASRTTAPLPPTQRDDTNRRYPWRGNRWKTRRAGRNGIARALNVDHHTMDDIGLTRDDIHGLLD